MISLLQTKFLIPRFTAERLARPHLANLVRDHLPQRLVMLVAPPGYGKTTLMAEVVDDAADPVLWYQLDEGDNDPATFVAYLVEGLRHTLPLIGERLRPLWEESGRLPADRALVILLNELVEHPPQAWTLVLDDYHLVSNPQVHALATTLLENPPPGLQVMISARSTPPLPLARWRARGRLLELHAEHLRFSLQETQQWLAKQAAPLPEAVVNQLVEKTEGWGAGLQLALNLLAEQPMSGAASEHLLARLDGAHPYIFNYLIVEAFEHQPAEVQDFLLRSAVLPQMNVAICRDVLHINDAPRLFELLERENLFLVSLDDRGNWFRYHHLFREFLLNRLARADQTGLTALQISVGDYYLRQNEPEAAAQQFLLASDPDRAICALRAFAADYLQRGRVDLLHRYFRQLGAAIDTRADLLLLHGRTLRERGHIQEAIARLRAALRVAADEDTVCLVLTELASIVRSQGDYRLAQQYDTDAYQHYPGAGPSTRAVAIMEAAKSEGYLNGMDRGRELAEQAIAAMQAAGSAISPYQQAELLRSLGQICWWQGDVRAAVAHCQQALRCVPNDYSPLVARILMTLAIPCLYRHEYDTALSYAERALAICQQLQLRELLPTAYSVLGNILTRVGQLAQAENCLRQAIDLAADLGAATYAQVMAAGYLAYNLFAQGRSDEARQIAESALWPYEGLPVVYEIYVCRSVLADCFLNEGGIDRARQIFDDLIDLGEQRQYRIALGMAYFGRAYICFIEGQRDTGLRLAQASLELLEPTHSWELYVDQRDRAVVVCTELGRVLPHSDFIQQVLRALVAPPLIIVPDKRGRIQVKTLGSLRVYRDQVEIDPRLWVSIKARDLLAYFVTFRHESIPLDRALEALWTEADHGSKTAFHTALYRLRKALRTAEVSAKYILVEVGDYRLDAARFEIDVDQFDIALKQAQKIRGAEALVWYQSAINLYEGEYLDNLYYDWLMPERARLIAEYLHALREAANLTARAQRFDEALALARKALAVDLLNEAIHCDIMRYLSALGDRQGVNHQYQTLLTLLRHELKTTPLPSTQKLFEQLHT